jgi:phosphoribosylanthranilate isomerase
MTWVKICGTTNLDDALLAVEAGADAVGFVFYEKSPRCVSVEMVREMTWQLPEQIEKIGVFVTGCSADPWDVLLKSGLTGVQFYMLPNVEGTRRQAGHTMGVNLLPKKTRMMAALPMSVVGMDEEHIQSLASDFSRWGENVPSGPREILNTVVLDSGDLRQPGGTGQRFDWERAVPIADAMKHSGTNLVVAGGLTAENVEEAIRTLKPWGVDVASGVEAGPGRKDPEKVRAFVRAVREHDRKAS